MSVLLVCAALFSTEVVQAELTLTLSLLNGPVTKGQTHESNIPVIRDANIPLGGPVSVRMTQEDANQQLGDYRLKPLCTQRGHISLITILGLPCSQGAGRMRAWLVRQEFMPSTLGIT
jgi:hypothetical protein